MIALVIACAVIAYISWQWYWRMQCLAPGSMGFPIIGETLQFVLDIRGFIRSRHALYGPVFRTHLFGTPAIFVSSIADTKKVFLGEGKLVNMQLIEPVHRLMENSLLTEHGDTHKEHRRLFYSMTKPDALKAITDLAVPMIRNELKQWPCKANVDILPRIRHIVFSLSLIAVLGEYDEAFRDKIEQLFMTFNAGMFALPLDIPLTKFGKAMKARQQLRMILMKEMNRRRNLSSANGLLSIFLASDMTEKQIISQTILAILAGFETTSFTISIVTHTLAKLPHVVDQLRDEQKELFPTGFKTLQKQSKLSAAVKESMRLFPTVPITGRVVSTSFVTSTGIRIPEKWRIFIGLEALSTFSNQDSSFSIKRWEEKHSEPEKWELATFGAGPRDCVGADLGRRRYSYIETSSFSEADIKSVKRYFASFPMSNNNL